MDPFPSHAITSQPASDPSPNQKPARPIHLRHLGTSPRKSGRSDARMGAAPPRAIRDALPHDRCRPRPVAPRRSEDHPRRKATPVMVIHRLSLLDESVGLEPSTKNTDWAVGWPLSFASDRCPLQPYLRSTPYSYARYQYQMAGVTVQGALRGRTS
ncbi:hypothetical protein LX36DRAFT_284413 [Colletotrichum falcatum]|nr:hypothetical protein LX36DRAFT_284413 [Colletotrichum falcatum]